MRVVDVFICHASEDKASVVRPIVEALKQAGISYWLDEVEIVWGDSITGKVNTGLSARYVIVVLSPASIAKNWPQRELYAALNIEATSGEVKVLPLLVGDAQELIKHYPLLNDKAYIVWGGNTRTIVEAILKRLGRDHKNDDDLALFSAGNSSTGIPLPKIQKKFSQLDRDRFLKNGYQIIRHYFEEALEDLKQHSQNVEIDIVDINNINFRSTIYIYEQIANQCRIWIGSLSNTSDIIACRYGHCGIESDNSMNDWLSVDDDGQTLGFKPSGMAFQYPDSRDKLLSPQAAAEYLWRSFTSNLG